MEEDVDVDFNEMMLQRARQSRHRKRGRIPTLRLHTREEDVSTQENTPASQEIHSVEYPSMCGQHRTRRGTLSEDELGDDLGTTEPQGQQLPYLSGATESQQAPYLSAATDSQQALSSGVPNGSRRPRRGRGPVPANNGRVQLKKNGNWTDEQLEKALSAITDDGLKIREAARVFNIPATSLRNHLWGTTNGRHRGICPTLKHDEELKLVDFIFKMQEIGYPLTPTDLRVKVAQATQARQTPWSATGLPGSGWLRSFRRRHPEISLRKSQELAVARARNMCPAIVEGFYANLEYLYSLHKYPESHIWNCDESGVQAAKNGGATVLAKKGSKVVNSITPDHREHISVLSCINAAGGKIPNFYIVKGKYFTANHIRGCEPGAVMGVQHNAWMTKFLFESWIAHFLRNLNNGPGVSQHNRHLLIVDGHTSHVTIEVTKTCMNNGIDIVTLPSHTSHALQPLDRTCFAPFKAAFRRIRDDWIRQHKNTKVEKSMLCEWTSKALGQALTPSNIKAGFRRCGIWPLDRAATAADMGPAEGFRTVEDVEANRDALHCEDGEGGDYGEDGDPGSEGEEGDYDAEAEDDEGGTAAAGRGAN